ncbi:MAG: N-acetylneuraminate synthase family protein [Planctomycetota bacterium]
MTPEARALPGLRTPRAIAGRAIGPEEPAWIVAEIGVNHDGDPRRAAELIESAARAGADAVKVQCFRAGALAAPEAALSAYQRPGAAAAAGQREMLARLELSRGAYPRLRAAAVERGLAFLASPFDEESLEFLLSLELPAIKLGSGELTNAPLLRRAAAAGIPMMLSTGMADWGEIEGAVLEARRSGPLDPILLQCVSAYPTPLGAANVRAVETLARRTGCLVGYSDHTLEDEPALAARALGACILERHLTHDRGASGPDHAVSLEEEDFRRWCAAIRRLEEALGDGEKTHTPLEEEGRRNARKSLHARERIPAGAVIDGEMLALLRPGGGLGPEAWERVVGARATREIDEGARILEEDLA